jgi:sorting and assembly machinery component 37
LSPILLAEFFLTEYCSFSTFLESKGQLLLDLSLYVSSQNYYQCTSPAYGSILQWPNQWIIPPKLRKAAKVRTEHLGLSSLDLEAVEEQGNCEQPAAVAAGQIPKSLIQRPRDTVSNLLRNTSRNSKFKLEALTAEFFEPLQELLGRKTCFLCDEYASSLNCLALGYLSLALAPELPYPWLQDSLHSKSPKLAQYVERMRSRCFGAVQLSDAFDTSQNASLLPWRPPQRITISKVSRTLLTSFADAMPILKIIRMNSRLQEAAKAPNSGLSVEESKAVSDFAKARKLDTYISIATVTAGVAAFVGYMFYEGLVRVSIESPGEMQRVNDLNLQTSMVNDSLTDDV